MNHFNPTGRSRRGGHARLIVVLCLIGVSLVWGAATWADRLEHRATANITFDEDPMEVPYRYLAVGWVDWAALQVEEISASDPGAAEAHFVLGLLAESSGDFGSAQRAYQRITALPDLDDRTRSAALVLLARAMVQAGRISDAKPLLAQAAELNQDSASVSFVLAWIAEAEGLVQQALDHYYDAMERSPYWIDPVVRAASIYNDMRNHVAALDMLLSNERVGSTYASYHHQLALGYWGMQSKAQADVLDEADREFLLASDIDPDNPAHRLGELAQQALNRALRLAPQDPQLLLLQSHMEGPALTYP